MHRLFYRLLAIFIILFVIPGKAQFFKRTHARANEHVPKAILVELPTEINRISYFNKKGKNDKVQTLTDANRKVIRVMVADFRDNFSYCPVYYFYDSSTELVKEKKFEGTLLDKKLEPVKDIILNKDDTDYFIVYYGTEPPEEEPAGAKKDPYNTSYTGSTVPTLIALSYNFKKLHYGLPDKPRYNHFSKNDYIPKYFFESKEFDISYTPLANYYSKTLEKYYTPRKH